MREYAKYQNESREFEDFFGKDITFKPKEFAETVTRFAHRANQETIAEFCKWFLYYCAKPDYGYDDRNEYAHRLGKLLTEGHEELF